MLCMLSATASLLHAPAKIGPKVVHALNNKFFSLCRAYALFWRVESSRCCNIICLNVVVLSDWRQQSHSEFSFVDGREFAKMEPDHYSNCEIARIRRKQNKVRVKLCFLFENTTTSLVRGMDDLLFSGLIWTIEYILLF